MAFSPIAFIAPNYRDFKNDYLKAYEPGTTTPKVMALDSTGAVTVAKLQLNADGFIKSAGGALVIPHINGSYDLWLFPSEAEADANDTSNAERLADNLSGILPVNSAVITLTTIDLINGVTVFDSDVVVLTSGFSVSGVGSDSWIQNGVTGQTLRQTPSQLGAALLNDGNGNQWELVVGNAGIDVKSLGATGLGIVDEFLPFAATIFSAIALQVKMYISAGQYYMPNNQSLLATTCVALEMYGDGDLSNILYDDYVNPTTFTPWLLGNITETIGRMTLRDFKVHGKWSEEVDFSENSTMIFFWHVDDLTVNNLTLENSRSALLLVEDCKVASVTDSRFRNSYRDACRIMQSESAIITGNYFDGIQDDSIAVSTVNPRRTYNNSRVTVSNNQIKDSPGIAILGGKNIIVTNNIIDRPMTQAIRVGQSAGFDTGDTSITSLTIAGNEITNPFRGTLFSSLNANEQLGIQIFCLPMLVKDTVGSWDGAKIIRPYENMGTFDTASGINASHWNLTVANNKIVRTLPPTTNYSDYGFGERLSREGFVNPSIADNDLWHDGLTINGAAYNLTISDNNIMGATNCIDFDTSGLSPTFKYVTWRNVIVKGNVLKDFRESGVKVIGNGLISIEGNDINGDPYITMPLRNGTDGSWQATFGQHVGINNSSGDVTIEVARNKFRNVGIPVSSGGGDIFWGKNTQYCEPVDTGFNAGNKGIGFVHSPAIAGSMNIEQADPTVAGFGRTINICLEATTTDAPPTTGTYVKGAYVYNGSELSQVAGWKRGTTGSNHTVGGIGSDWIILFGTP